MGIPKIAGGGTLNVLAENRSSKKFILNPLHSSNDSFPLH